ncbi:MAG: phosphoribosylformylglycinamidine synthase subunit PurQ [Solirubrobacteraceae bacterium]
MRFGVLRFPGSCDELDAALAAGRVGDAEIIWHGERDLKGVDAVIVPGGFSYGDYLRAGAIARFAPVMESVIEFAAEGGLVLGICNGFQVLCEARLLPGALLPNANRRFTFRQVRLEVLNPRTAFTCACAPELPPPDASLHAAPATATGTGTGTGTGTASAQPPPVLSIPAKHSWGRWYAPEGTVREMTARGQIVLRYARGESFNGSVADAAGVCNEAGNVFGMMPHPEHAVDPLTGSSDGLAIFESMRLAVEARRDGAAGGATARCESAAGGPAQPPTTDRVGEAGAGG